MSVSFTEMGLAAPLLQALTHLNITNPTPVQATMVPKAMAGGDYMVSSQTGSGKTFGFLLPVMHRMMATEMSPMDAMNGPETLVLCPTRELAQQVSQDAINLVKFHKGLRIATVMGGMPYGKQMAGLKGARLVVGTPGRLLDLADQRKLNLSRVTTLIVDEADRMLDLGFSDDLKALSDLCGGRGQTLMFSATFAPRVMGLANSLLNNPERIELSPSNETNTDISQTLHWADSYSHKRKLLSHWLNDESIDQAVVFTSTQQDAEELAQALGDDGLQASALHGAMPQVVRNRRLAAVRRGEIKILVATDVAARGLDVPSISHVINFGMPMKAEDYVHRIGRTGRAGRSGTAITLAQADDRGKIREIERYINAQIPIAVIEGLEPRMPLGGDRGGKGGRGGKPSPRSGSGGRDRRSFGEGRPSFGERKSFGEGRPSFGERKSFGDNRGGEGRREFNRDERPAFRGNDERPAFRGNDERPARFNRDQAPRHEERAPRFAREPGRDGDRPNRFAKDFSRDSERPARFNADGPRGGKPNARFAGERSNDSSPRAFADRNERPARFAKPAGDRPQTARPSAGPSRGGFVRKRAA